MRPKVLEKNPHNNKLCTPKLYNYAILCIHTAQCHSLEELEYGNVCLEPLSSYRQLTQLVRYNCDTGYVFVGPRSRECIYTLMVENRESGGKEIRHRVYN